MALLHARLISVVLVQKMPFSYSYSYSSVVAIEVTLLQ